jgi:hypothetical protein
MSYTLVNTILSTSTPTSTTSTASVTVAAGQQLIIEGMDGGSNTTTLTLTDSQATPNTYVKRGVQPDTREGFQGVWFDCLSPAVGTYNLEMEGSVEGGGQFIVRVVTGLGAFTGTLESANFATGTMPSTTDGITTPAITPGSFPAVVMGMAITPDGGTTFHVSAGTGFGNFFQTSTTGFAQAAEDQTIISNSQIASFTAAAGQTDDVIVMGAAYTVAGGTGVTLDGAASSTTSATGNLTDQRNTTVFNQINLGTTPGDGTGDPVKVGMIKVKADLGALVAGLTRRATTTGVFGITSAAGTTTALTDASQNWAANQFAGQTLSILTGPLAGFSESIASNTATTITVSAAFESAIGATIGYQVQETAEANADGYATSAGGTAPATLTDGNKSWTTNQWQDFTAHFLSGAYAGQRLRIASNTATTLTFTESLNPGIAAGTSYAIGAIVPNLDTEFGLRSIQGPPVSDLLAVPGFYSLEQTTSTVYTLFAANNVSTELSTVGARVRVINVGSAPAVIAPSSNAAGQFINNVSTLTNNEVTLAPVSSGVAQYAEFQCMLSDSGVTYWAVVTTGTIS